MKPVSLRKINRNFILSLYIPFSLSMFSIQFSATLSYHCHQCSVYLLKLNRTYCIPPLPFCWNLMLPFPPDIFLNLMKVPGIILWFYFGFGFSLPHWNNLFCVFFFQHFLSNSLSHCISFDPNMYWSPTIIPRFLRYKICLASINRSTLVEFPDSKLCKTAIESVHITHQNDLALIVPVSSIE